MNDFIGLRKSFLEYENPNGFSLAYLRKYRETDQLNEYHNSDLFDKVEKMMQLNMQSDIKEDEIIDALQNIGDNDYLNRLISNLVIENFQIIHENLFEQTLSLLMGDGDKNDSMLYSLIDLCIECDMKILSHEKLKTLMKRYKRNNDIVSILIDYMYHFKIDSLRDELYEFMNSGLADNIKIQILDVLVELYSIEELKRAPIKEVTQTKRLYADYVKILRNEMKHDKDGLVLMQAMFQGSFDSEGKGNNGGIAVLLKNLGNALSKDDRVAKVISVSINNEWSSEKSLKHCFSGHHMLIRMPIYIDSRVRDPFLKKERFIYRFMVRLFERMHIEPDIFHIRFLDNASKSVASLCESTGKKLVLTLTADPHRRMVDENGQIKVFNQDKLLSMLNRINIGDELIYKCDGIMGIGKKKVGGELLQYFPQLIKRNISIKLRMIDEAIQINPLNQDINIEDMFRQLESLLGIQKKLFENPVILNVGRLNQLKGQDNLLKAWGSSRFSSDYSLLIIGGDIENPNEEEQIIMEAFENYLKVNPHLKNRFCHIGALSNESIRIIEKKIISRQFLLPHIYLCSSKKEEFGVAILEAMSEGFLVLAPIEGGAKSYINHGSNGFLIDTGSWSSIAKEAVKIVYKSNITGEEFEKIQNRGIETVLRDFTMDKVSREMLSFYLSLKGVRDEL